MADAVYKEALAKVTPDFVEQLFTEDLLDQFEAVDFLTSTVLRDLRETKTTSERTRSILQHVKRSGPEKYVLFKQLLARTQQEHLVKMLEDKERAIQREAEVPERGARDVSRGADRIPERGARDEVDASSGVERNDATTIIGKVLKKSSTLNEYVNKQGTKIQYFNIIIGEGSSSTNVRCYQKQKLDFVREGLTYKFGNVIKKGDDFLVIHSSSIGIVPHVLCSISPSSQVLPEAEPAAGQNRTIKAALDSHHASTVCAKVVKASPVVMQREGVLAVRCLAIKDETAVTKVVLFENLAEQEYPDESVIRLSGLYKRRWNQKDHLVASKITKLEFVSIKKLESLPVTGEDHAFVASDTDFKKDKVTIAAITNADIYQACSYDGCFKKKLKNGICPNCGKLEGVQTYRVAFEVVKEDNSTFVTTLFQKDIDKIFGSVIFDGESDKFILIERIVEMLPKTVVANVKNNTLFNIEK